MRDTLNSPVRIEKLFRASEHGFKADAFHEKCDNQNDTLLLVRTEFGKTIGGYTHYPWQPENPWHFSDVGRRAFIFSLDMQEKFVPISDQLIYHIEGNGPAFGTKDGGDISIKDDCNNIRNSLCNFPYGYNRVVNKLKNNQESYKLFSGATNGRTFKV